MANMKSILRRTSSGSSYSSSSGTSDDDNDDGKPIKPIKDYISDRKDLAHQLFCSVKAEKIRMMLPQTLKKVDLKELEEWCASELSGMSKSRILAILASTTMAQSSATSESDDSGPSLEIISDTEAWITDSEQQQTIKQEGKSSVIKNKHKRKYKKNSAEDKSQNKSKSAPIKPDDSSLACIKREEIKEVKPQEGESLLDLLELEMRARAIRALIRKEEDIIPNVGEQSAVGNALKETLNSIALHEKNINDKENNTTKECESRLVNIGEDEDLVLVVKPTPTISLLSSDGESEDSAEHTPSEKVLENEHRKKRTENKVLTTDERRVHVRENSGINSDTLEIVVTTQPRETNREKIVTCEKPVIITQIESHENNQIKKTNGKPVKKTESLKKSKKKKIKLPLNSTDLKLNSTTSNEINEESKLLPPADCKPVEIKKTIKVIHEETMIDKVVMIKKSTLHDPPVTNKLSSLIDNDYEEIIDLDAYPDDMDDMEINENSPSISEIKIVKKIDQANPEDLEKPSLWTETWASRYYQTDSVQNVIKDSKIQSEIRKRLRERQKLSKLNNLKLNPIASQKSCDAIESKPTGSVEEYLALKAIVDTDDTNNSENRANPREVTEDSSDNTNDKITNIEKGAEGDKETSITSIEIAKIIP